MRRDLQKEKSIYNHYNKDVANHILDFLCGQANGEVFHQIKCRIRLYHELAQPGMLRELTFYWNRTLQIGHIWKRSDLLEHIVSFVIPGYCEKSESYTNRFAGDREHQYLLQDFTKMWCMNGQPYDLSYYRAISGRFDRV